MYFEVENNFNNILKEGFLRTCQKFQYKVVTNYFISEFIETCKYELTSLFAENMNWVHIEKLNIYDSSNEYGQKITVDILGCLQPGLINVNYRFKVCLVEYEMRGYGIDVQRV